MVALGAGASPAAADACPNAQYRTGPSANLADCRAYEQVSPINKNGGDVTPDALAATLRYGSGLTATPVRGPVPLQIWQAATGGDAVAYSSRAAFAGSLGSLGLNPYIARRGATGWTTQSLTPPMNASPLNPSYYVNQMQYQQYAPDLSGGVLMDIDPAGPLLAEGAIGEYANLYLRDNASGRFTTVSTVAPPNTSPTGAALTYAPRFQGASSDYSHVVFTAPDALTPNAQGPCNGCQQLYERTSGAIRSVNVLPGGSTAPDAALGSTWQMALQQNQSQTQGAVSDDGTKIYWSALHGTATPADVYVRVNGSHTVPVGSGTFWAGSPDGRQAIYLSGYYGKPGDLYKFTLDSQASPPTGSSVNLTPNANGQVLGVVGTSADLSYVYFVATAALAPDAVAGSPNLYLYHEGDGAPIRLIATLPSGEGSAQSPGNSGGSIDSRTPNDRTAYVTPDGRHLAFVSAGALTGYATTPSHPMGCVDHVSHTAGCNEVFAYDADTSTLTCASCKAAGTSPDGPSMVVPAQNQSHDPHVLSDDGSRLFFQSWDKLVPADTNGQQDVYEWVPNGAHGCAKATGCVSLISGGTGGTADPGVTNAPLNAFVDASPDGKNVFFTTVQSLVPDDVDGASDLYVARVDGGLASQHRPPAPAPCVGDRCRPGAGAAAPLLASPGSVAYVAPFAPAPRAPAESSAGKVSVKRPKTVRGKTKVRLSVRAPGKGRIRVSGPGLRRATKTAKKSKTYRVTVKLSKRSKRILKRKHRVKVRATVRFSPEHGKASRARVYVTFKQKRHHGEASRRSHDRAHRSAGKDGR